MYKVFVLLCFLAVATAFVDSSVEDFERKRMLEDKRREEAEGQRQTEEIAPSRFRYYRSVSNLDFEPIIDLEEMDLEPYTIVRQRRSQLPNAGGVNIEKSGDNTIGRINVGRKTDRYDVGATWQKVLHGPNRGKPNLSIGGTYRW